MCLYNADISPLNQWLRSTFTQLGSAELEVGEGSLLTPNGRQREFLGLKKWQSILNQKKFQLQQENIPVEARTESCDVPEVYWEWNPPRPKTHVHPTLLQPPFLDQGYDQISGQSSLLCDRSNLVTMAAGISGDGLQRVRGVSRGLRNNKRKAVTVTFELRVMGLTQRFEARGVREWTGVTHNPGGQRILRRSWQDLQRTQWGAVVLKPLLIMRRVEGAVRK